MFGGMFEKKSTTAAPSHPEIERARQMAYLLDSGFKIPVVGWKIGLDPLLGLAPGAGDVIAGLLALYIVVIAYRLGMPNHVLTRMVVYTLADILLGLVPLVGDVADFFWKSNRKNLELLEASYKQYGHGYRHRIAKPSDYQGVTIDVNADAVQ